VKRRELDAPNGVMLGFPRATRTSYLTELSQSEAGGMAESSSEWRVAVHLNPLFYWRRGEDSGVRSQEEIEGFTMLELLVVMVIAGMLLVVAAGAWGSGGVGGGPRAGRDQVLGVLGRARAQAVARGRPVAVVAADTVLGNEAAYRRLNSLEVVRSAGGGYRPRDEGGKLAARWEELPKGVVLLAEGTAECGPTVFEAGVRIEGVGDREAGEVSLPAVVFGARGQVLAPGQEVWFHVASGFVSSEGAIRRTGGGEARHERIRLSRATGRARVLAGR